MGIGERAPPRRPPGCGKVRIAPRKKLLASGREAGQWGPLADPAEIRMIEDGQTRDQDRAGRARGLSARTGLHLEPELALFAGGHVESLLKD